MTFGWCPSGHFMLDWRVRPTFSNIVVTCGDVSILLLLI